MNDISITIYKVGELQTNCYILSKDSKCLIFDAGDSGDFILEKALEKKLKPIAIFASHGHFDHVMAVGEIQLSFNIPFYISKEDLFLLDRAEKTAEFFLHKKIPFILPKNIKNLKEGNFKLDGFKFNIVKTPGHTPGSTCFYFGSFILTGDTLFKGAVGRYDFSYSDKKELKRSINRLFEFPNETLVYPGHEKITTIGIESTNQVI
ncbi:MAG: MBL fold metallo-hydrolase [bacterium]